MAKNIVVFSDGTGQEGGKGGGGDLHHVQRDAGGAPSRSCGVEGADGQVLGLRELHATSGVDVLQVEYTGVTVMVWMVPARKWRHN